MRAGRSKVLAAAKTDMKNIKDAVVSAGAAAASRNKQRRDQHAGSASRKERQCKQPQSQCSSVLGRPPRQLLLHGLIGGPRHSGAGGHLHMHMKAKAHHDLLTEDD